MPRPRRADQLADISTLSCPERVVHFEAVRHARAALPSGNELAGVAEIFNALADPTRLRIVAALTAGELCVCDLAATVCQSESAISHQLRLMRALGLVRARRDGRRVYYALDDDHVTALYNQACDHVAHSGNDRG